jgi:hypothetical protein
MELFANNTRIPFSGALSLKFLNPMFNDIGDHSLPVSFNAKLPSTKKAFGFAGIQTVDWAKEVPAKIKTRLLTLEGNWEISEPSTSNIEAFFKGGTGNFYSLAGDKLLSSLTFGGIKYPIGTLGTPEEVLAYMNTKMEAVYPDDDYVAFCAYMPAAYGADTPDIYKWVNEVEHDEDGNPSFKGFASDDGNDTVYLFAGVIIDYIFEEFGYSVGRNVFKTNPYLQRLVIFNAYNRRRSYAFDYTKLVPKIKCTDFLKAITNRFNIGFFINEQSRIVDIVSFEDILRDKVKQLNCKFTSVPKVDNRRTTGMNFGIMTTDSWNSNTFKNADEFRKQVNGVVNKYRDIPEGQNVGTPYWFVKSENTYYKKVLSDEVWINERICSNIFPYNAGENGREINQLSGIPGMYNHIKTVQWQAWVNGELTNLITDVDFVMPLWDSECTDESLPANEFPLMFLFSRGIQASYIVPQTATLEQLLYPLGNNDIYDATGAELAGDNLSLKWDGEDGLVSNFWSNRVTWEFDIKRIVKGIFTADDIPELIDFSHPVRIENNNYIVNAIDVELDGDRIRVTDAELFKL